MPPKLTRDSGLLAVAALPFAAVDANIGCVNASRTLRQQTFLLVASLGPLGHLPASGTVTAAILGVPLYYVMHTWPPAVRVGITLGFTLLSVWVHHVGDRILGTKDSGKLVWDELAGFLIGVMLLGEFTWRLAVLAFFCERALDVLKIPPANWVERRLPGGWGVVGDDVIAGLYTCGLLLLVVHWQPGLIGM